MDAKEEIKRRLSVEDVIGEYVELKKAGSNWRGFSPFTKENNPSFMVSPEKQIWHDFSSGQGGDIFSFVMLAEGIEFKEAMEILARKAGVELTQYRGSGQAAKKKKRLMEANKVAEQFFLNNLSKSKTAKDYLVKQRKLGRKVIEDFKVGYAPKGNKLVEHLKKKGFSQAEILASGLGVKRKGLVDMFRHRIMVPLADNQGRPVGFTGRVLDDSMPKYINTPQTMVYDKSRNIFALHLAKEGIRKAGFSVIVEGQFDVISSHQAGTTNVVASTGTAITKDQFSQLSYFSDDVRLAFDQDSAGLDAMERAIPNAQAAGIKLSIISLEGSKDPDDLIQQSKDKWKKTIEDELYVVDWLIKRYKDQFDLSTAVGKREYTGKILKVIALVSDSVEQDHYVQQLARDLNISAQSITQKLLSSKPLSKKKAIKIDKDSLERPTSVYQDLLLGLNLLYSDINDLDGVNIEFFDGQERQKVAKYLLSKPKTSGDKVPTQLKDIEDYVKIILFKTEELYGDWPVSDRIIESAGLVRRLKEEAKKRHRLGITRKIREAEQSGDQKAKAKLLEEFNQLLKEK